MQNFLRSEFRPGFFISLAFFLLLLPLQWLLALLFAAGFHEMCHLLALKACGGHPNTICLGATGAVICANPLSPGRAIFCTLAGPIGSLSLVLLAPYFQRLALCALIQSVYNLLPLHNLDGGHALEDFLSLFLLPKTVNSLCRITEGCLFIVTIILSLYATFILHLGLLPILIAGNIVIKVTEGKFPCKTRPMRVQ